MQPNGFFSNAQIIPNVGTNPKLAAALPVCSMLCPLGDGNTREPRRWGVSSVPITGSCPASISLYWILVG